MTKLKPCRTCGKAAPDGYCDKHPKPKQRDGHTESAHKRGYDRRWRKFRKRYLAEHPWCRDCAQIERVTPATEIHHIKKLADNPLLKYEARNLMPLCHECHHERTLRGE